MFKVKLEKLFTKSSSSTFLLCFYFTLLLLLLLLLFYFIIIGLFYFIIVLLFTVKNKMYYKFTICEKLSRVKKYMSCKTLQNHEHLFMGMADNKQ